MKFSEDSLKSEDQTTDEVKWGLGKCEMGLTRKTLFRLVCLGRTYRR